MPNLSGPSRAKDAPTVQMPLVPRDVNDRDFQLSRGVPESPNCLGRAAQLSTVKPAIGDRVLTDLGTGNVIAGFNGSRALNVRTDAGLVIPLWLLAMRVIAREGSK